MIDNNTISVAERKDLLILAQQKLDEMNRGNSFLSGNSKSKTATSLLSTLLYLAIMTYRLEDMKAMLKDLDYESYEQWEDLFGVLHNPEFRVKERSLQNERFARTLERKRLYKAKAADLNKKVHITSSKLDEVQRISNETNNEMSKTINAMQEEISKLSKKLQDAHTEAELKRNEVKDEVTKKDLIIADLKQQLRISQARVGTIESQLAELQQRLTKAEANNTSLHEEIASLSGGLEKNVALILKASKQLLDESQTARTEDRSTLLDIGTRIDVLQKKQIDVDDFLPALRSTTLEEFQAVRNMLEKLITKPSPDMSAIQSELQALHCTLEKLIKVPQEPNANATAFVENVLSEAFATTICST